MLATDQDTNVTAGLGAVFMAHRQRLTVFLRARCRGLDAAEVDDIMQELWLRCQRVDARLLTDPKSYLYRMGHNLALDRQRRFARGRDCETDWGYVNACVEGSAEEAVAERRLLARERLEAIDRTLRAVGERAAWIFHRFRIDGVPQHRIAEELGLSLSTVEKDMRKAYEALLALRRRSDEE